MLFHCHPLPAARVLGMLGTSQREAEGKKWYRGEAMGQWQVSELTLPSLPLLQISAPPPLCGYETQCSQPRNRSRFPPNICSALIHISIMGRNLKEAQDRWEFLKRKVLKVWSQIILIRRRRGAHASCNQNGSTRIFLKFAYKRDLHRKWKDEHIDRRGLQKLLPW